MDLKDLEKMLKVCRKQGVDEISVGGVSVKFGAMPRKQDSTADEVEQDVADSISYEELVYGAVREGL